MDKEIISLVRMIVNRTLITISDIENETDATKRQITYRLEKLNALLESNNLLPIVLGSQKEFLIHADTRDFLIQFLFDIHDDIEYYLDREERKIYIYLLLFVDREYLSLQHFISALQISKSTVIQDLNELTHDLKEQHISLKNDRLEGYYLQGDEMELRRYMMRLIFLSISEHRNTRVLDKFIEDEHLDTFAYSKLIIQELADQYDISFVEDRLVEFIYIFIFLKTRIVEGIHVNKSEYRIPNVDMIRTFKEYDFTNSLIDYYPTRDAIADVDRKYISSWILGISVGNVEDKSEDCLIIGQLVGKIMTRFELISGIHYRDSETIFRHIFSHFRPAYYRLLFKLPIFNPLRDRVKDEYTSLYALVKETMKPFASIFGEEVGDDELAYLTMHFASIYTEKREEQFVNRQQALIVCLNGIGSSVILYNELRTLFPELEFHLPIEVSQFSIEEYPVDIIFTTKFFQDLHGIEIPVIKVSPIMDATERYTVFREVMAQLGTTNKRQPTVDEITSIIRRHVGVTEHEHQLVSDLMHTFTNVQTPKVTQRSAQDDLRHLVTEEIIALKVAATDWHEALEYSGNLLVSANKVEPRYVEKVINIQRMNPSYYVIAPHIALPHTTPQNGVIERAIGIVTLETPIYFGNKDNDPVKYIFYLAATDNESHINAMTQLLELMNNQAFLTLLDTATSAQEVLAYLDKI